MSISKFRGGVALLSTTVLALTLLTVLTVKVNTSFALTPCLSLEAGPHPCIGSFPTGENPNGIAVDEANETVYVASLGTDDIYKYDATGNPLEFSDAAKCEAEKCGYIEKNKILGTPPAKLGEPAVPFSFPSVGGNPAAIAVDNACVRHIPVLTGKACEEFDPSAGDLYLMDAGNEVIDKFNSEGKYLSQITGPFSGEPLGLAVDASGEVRVEIRAKERPVTDVFDDSAANGFLKQLGTNLAPLFTGQPEYGFAAGGPSGAGFSLFSCGCIAKTGSGSDGTVLGRVDSGPGAVDVAVDPVTGHVYVDDRSSVSEFDTGQMNGSGELNGSQETPTGVLVSTFGSPELTSASVSGQGGIAVNGATGDIYVSDPAEGKVDVFASTAADAVVGTPTGVTRIDATLHATVDPRGVSVTSCQFEYGTSRSLDLRVPILHFDHTVPCDQTPGQIGAGTQAVEVSAHITGLQPGSLYRFRLLAANENGAAPSDGLFPTAAPGFGIKNFEVLFLNQDGTPDTQAGSHPYKLVNTIEFNTQVVHPEASSLVYSTLPVGNVKDITLHLPPGFYGDTNATAKKCTLQELSVGGLGPNLCPQESEIGTLEAEIKRSSGDLAPSTDLSTAALWSAVPPPGVPFQMAAHFILPNAFINVGLPAGGDSGLTATSEGLPPSVPLFRSSTTVYGIPPHGATRPLLTMPTACNGPLTSTMSADSYQEAGHFATATTVTRNAAGAPAGMTGCAKLEFPPSISVAPDAPDASTSSGLTVGVHVSQKAALNPTGLAESGVRDLTVRLPEGVAINPADADGLEACSEGLAGFKGFAEFNSALEPGDKTATFTPELPNPLQPGTNFCPNGSKIGTAKIKTPLLPNPLEGTVYLAAQEANPFGSLLAMYLVAEDPVSGTIIKQTGEVQLCESAGQPINGVSCQTPGQIVATFKNLPNDPFEEAELHFFGGERAPLRTPSRCGTYTTYASFIPWDGNGPVNTTSSFQITSGPHGSQCPGASLPFTPSANAGSTNIQAGAFSPFTLSFTRHDGEQNVQSVTATLPPGLSGMISNIALCPEPNANEGTCPESSLIGTTTASVGVGGHPFVVEGGRDYLTGPYNGTGACTVGSPGCAPFGLTFEVPPKAGPFDFEKTAKHHPACDCLVVRGKIEINPITSALTITSDPPGNPDAIPTTLEGIPLEVQDVNATTTRGNFQFNPTSCAKMALVGHLFSSENAQDTIELPYQVTNCAALKFEPKLSVSTSGKTSKANGASLTAKVTYPNVPQGTDADIAKVKVELPKQLPSRLTTLQRACTARQFEANPAGCPPESKIGYAVVHTPVLPVPLEGPAIFVSHGGEAFPSLTMVLQGDNVTIDLVGTTFISKKGITSTDFKTVPDQPFSTFELTLPQRKFSALTANGSLCSSTKTVLVKRKVIIRVKGRRKQVTRKVRETQPAALAMPTEFVGQNGAVIHQTTQIAVTGCSRKKARKASSHRHGRGTTKR
jgi:DNA-binding beta-propeller fold protein YncE